MGTNEGSWWYTARTGALLGKKAYAGIRSSLTRWSASPDIVTSKITAWTLRGGNVQRKSRKYVLVVAPRDLDVSQEQVHAEGHGWRVLDPRERVEGDQRLRGGDGGREGGVLLQGDVDERDLDGVALL
jgi:hypothetical protein